MGTIIDINNCEFGYLKVIKYIGNSNNKSKIAMWLCKCVCGKKVAIRSDRLRNGEIKSCGCKKTELLRQSSKCLGESVTAEEYIIWIGMLNRCYRKSHVFYERYGGRGIKVCDAWRHDYLMFLRDIGRRPSKKHSLDRIDNNGNYNPLNCKWSTQKEQARNRRNNINISFNNMKKTIPEWSEITGIKTSTIRERLKRGWSVEKALTSGCG